MTEIEDWPDRKQSLKIYFWFSWWIAKWSYFWNGLIWSFYPNLDGNSHMDFWRVDFLWILGRFVKFIDDWECFWGRVDAMGSRRGLPWAAWSSYVKLINLNKVCYKQSPKYYLHHTIFKKIQNQGISSWSNKF